MTSRLTFGFFPMILATFLVLPSLVSADLEDGLIGYYPMEGKDKVLRDETGNGNDGQIITAKRTRDGKFGDGLLFDAQNHSAVIHKTERLTVEKEFAVSFWVKPKKLDLVGENRAIYKDGQYNIDILSGAGRIEIRVGGVWKGTGPGEKLILDEWNHIVGTLHKGTASYYTNAAAMGNNNGVGKIAKTDSRIQLGFMGLNAFVGVMDDLRIYDRGFDAKEVQELFEFEPDKPQSVSSLNSVATTWGAIKRLR